MGLRTAAYEAAEKEPGFRHGNYTVRGDIVLAEYDNNNKLVARHEGDIWEARIVYGDGAEWDQTRAPTWDQLLEQEARAMLSPPLSMSEEFAAVYRRVTGA